MPHAMTEAFTVEEPMAAPADEAGDGSHMALRQHESETPNERAMRTATAARKAAHGGTGRRAPRQQG